MIFLDTNVVSEIMRTSPDVAVLTWLKRNENALALSAVVIAEISFGIERNKARRAVAPFGADFQNFARALE